VKIIVCIKQVPDTETQIKIAPGGKAIVKDDIKWVMNPYDEFGVEEALRIKEKLGARWLSSGSVQKGYRSPAHSPAWEPTRGPHQ